MTRDIDRMSEAERAEFYDQHANEIMADEGEEIPVEHSSAPASVTTSFRMSQEEARLIRHAAEAAGLTQSEWIRSVCVTAARAPKSKRVAMTSGTAHRLRTLLHEADSIMRTVD